MLYQLTETEIQNTPEAFYWTEGGNIVTSLDFLETVLVYTDAEIPEGFFDNVAQWTHDNSFLIYDYYIQEQRNFHTQPKHVIFPQQLTQALYKVSKLSYGDRVETIHYQGYNKESEALTNPLVKITYKYNRDSNHYLKYVERTFSWMLKSGEWSPNTFTDIKPFTTLAAKTNELGLVRRNIIEEAQTLAKQMGLLQEMLQIYHDFDRQVSLYLGAGTSDLSFAVQNADIVQYGWLDNPTSDGKNTVRQFLTYFFSIGVIDAES